MKHWICFSKTGEGINIVLVFLFIPETFDRFISLCISSCDSRMKWIWLDFVVKNLTWKLIWENLNRWNRQSTLSKAWLGLRDTNVRNSSRITQLCSTNSCEFLSGFREKQTLISGSTTKHWICLSKTLYTFNFLSNTSARCLAKTHVHIGCLHSEIRPKILSFLKSFATLAFYQGLLLNFLFLAALHSNISISTANLRPFKSCGSTES